jgi:hypothetical protein
MCDVSETADSAPTQASLSDIGDAERELSVFAPAWWLDEAPWQASAYHVHSASVACTPYSLRARCEAWA